MHEARKTFAAEPSNQPVEPIQVSVGTPVGNADVNMMCQLNSTINCSSDYLGRKQAVWFLPHEQDAICRCLFKRELVGKIKIGIEKNHLRSRLTQKIGIGNLSPAWMPATECAQIRMVREQRCFAIRDILDAGNRPVMFSGIDP